jgi:hypothetical protein
MARTAYKPERLDQYGTDNEKANNKGTTYDFNFLCVSFRHIDDIPRMSSSDRRAATGATFPTTDPDGTGKVFSLKGEPLFLAESKPIPFWVSFFKAIKAKAIFDMTPGSGAAAIAALLVGIPYDGLCHNQKHKDWLDTIMNKIIFHIVMKQEKNPDMPPEMVKKCNKILRGPDSRRRAHGARHEPHRRYRRRKRLGLPLALELQRATLPLALPRAATSIGFW